LDKVIEDSERIFFYRDGQVGRRIDLSQVLCIKADGRYIDIRCADESFKVRYSLKRALPMLPGNFCRAHGSYIVNLEKVEELRLNADEIVVGGHTVPIGRKFKKDFLQRLVIL